MVAANIGITFQLHCRGAQLFYVQVSLSKLNFQLMVLLLIFHTGHAFYIAIIVIRNKFYFSAKSAIIRTMLTNLDLVQKCNICTIKNWHYRYNRKKNNNANRTFQNVALLCLSNNEMSALFLLSECLVYRNKFVFLIFILSFISLLNVHLLLQIIPKYFFSTIVYSPL